MENIVLKNQEIAAKPWQLALMNFKAIWNGKFIIYAISLFFVISLLLPIIFMPFYGSGAMIMLYSVALPILLVLGYTGYNYKQSSLYDNLKTSAISGTEFNIGQIITVFILGNILSLLIWILIFFAGQGELLLTSWIWDSKPSAKINPFSHFAWINIIYSTQIICMVSFSFYYVLKDLIKTSQNYYMVVMIIVILGFIFGGTLNTYFGYPYNFELHDAFHTEVPSDGFMMVDMENEIIYVNEVFWNLIKEPVVYNENGLSSMYGLFPDSIFIPTLFFPFYAIGEFSTCSITRQSTQEISWMVNYSFQLVEIVGGEMNVVDPNLAMYSTNGAVNWFSWYNLSFNKDGWMWAMVLLQPYLFLITSFFVGTAINLFKKMK